MFADILEALREDLSVQVGVVAILAMCLISYLIDYSRKKKGKPTKGVVGYLLVPTLLLPHIGLKIWDYNHVSFNEFSRMESIRAEIHEMSNENRQHLELCTKRLFPQETALSVFSCLGLGDFSKYKFKVKDLSDFEVCLVSTKGDGPLWRKGVIEPCVVKINHKYNQE